MIKANFCISIDTNGDRHVSLPWREPKLHDWLQIASYTPSALCEVRDIAEAIRAYGEYNQKRVNEILSKYY